MRRVDAPEEHGVALSVFDDRNARPAASALAKALGRAVAAWNALKEGVASDCGAVEEWTFSSAKAGWTLRLKHRKRVIVYMTPCKGHFLASFALGERACMAAEAAGLPPDVLAAIAEAPKYVEGRGVRIPVRTPAEAAAIRALAAIKLAH
jgi:hypothetical protein